MPLKITDPQKQTAVLNRWADFIEGLVRKNTIAINGVQHVASAAATAASTTTAPLSNIRVIVSNYTITPTDQVILVNSPSPVTIFLSAIIGQKGQVWRVKNINKGVITCQPSSGLQSVDTFAFLTLDLTRQSFDILFDGANWWIL
jgi:hypothetical protein